MLEAFLKPILGWLLKILTFGIRDRREADKELFEKLYQELDINSDAALLLRDHDFCQAFSPEYLIPLNYIPTDWLQPINKFHSFFLEKKKNKFVKDLKLLTDELDQHLAPDQNGLI